MRLNLNLLSILVLLIITGCTKSDLPDLITSYNKVKLYDDTLPDPRNRALRIAAGNNRLFMNYCYDFEKFQFVNGVSTIPPPPRNQWMITDNEGNLIKRDSFPTGLTMADVVFLNDNSIMAILYNAHSGFSGNNYELLYFHFDQNGQKISGDTLTLPAGITLTGPSMDDHQLVHLIQSLNGNPFLYFETYDQQTYAQFSLAGELNTDGSFEWYKTYADIKITGGISTQDGGYIFVGSDVGDYYNTLPGFAFIMKTTADGDSLWTKTYDALNPANVKITAGDNGNYFFCFNDVDFLVYEVNATGDSLNAFVINEVGTNLPAAIVSKDGGVFTLINKDLTIYVAASLTDQVNTHFICLDAGLNITQKGLFQKETSDMIFACCKTSVGKIACFGIIQSYNRRYYKPELIIVN